MTLIRPVPAENRERKKAKAADLEKTVAALSEQLQSMAGVKQENSELQDRNLALINRLRSKEEELERMLREQVLLARFCCWSVLRSPAQLTPGDCFMWSEYVSRHAPASACPNYGRSTLLQVCSLRQICRVGTLDVSPHCAACTLRDMHGPNAGGAAGVHEDGLRTRGGAGGHRRGRDVGQGGRVAEQHLPVHGALPNRKT